MTRAAAQRKTKRISIGQVHEELQRLRSRVEDLEDLRDLNAAIERNAGKAAIPWADVKKEVGL